MLTFELAMLSKPGGRRYNEDACGHWASDQHLCCVLADGAGGHGGGDIASRLAVTYFLNGFFGNPASSGAELIELVQRVNQSILQDRKPEGATRDMHTTLVALMIDRQLGLASWAHSGDSRLYWFRQGRLMQRTRDHSFVQALLDAGAIAENEVRGHPSRSVLRSALGEPTHELEADASVPFREVAAGDRFLLCSDGVWEYLTDDMLEQALQTATTAQQWVDLIEGLIVEATRSLPSHDNFTALAVWLAAPGAVDA